MYIHLHVHMGLYNFHLVDAYIVSHNVFKLGGRITCRRYLNGSFGKFIDRSYE